MGQVDYHNLNPIYRECVKYYKEHDLDYGNIKIDGGNWETAIEFTAIGYNHPPKSKSWEEVEKEGNTIKCPDILNFKERWLIELEEEGQKKRSGARLATKGHGREFDLQNKKDIERDYFYRIAGFSVLHFYEADLKSKNWSKIYNFLNNPTKERET